MSAERVKLTLGQRSAAVSTANPQGPVNETFDQLLAEVRACTVCAPHLPFGPRPVLRGRPSARLLIISQAPGTRAHESGLSFNDRSGDKLRQWLALGWETFYDESRVAIMPIGLCYPGRDARGGDLPPRRECARRWHTRLRAALPAIELTLLVGSYAIHDYLPHSRRHSMTETVARWREFLPEYFVLPHPSWHTIRWLRDNPWFENEALPDLRTRIGSVLEPEALDCMPRCAPAEEPDPAADSIPRR
jgi:uracil-DNA glycosylase